MLEALAPQLQALAQADTEARDVRDQVEQLSEEVEQRSRDVEAQE